MAERRNFYFRRSQSNLGILQINMDIFPELWEISQHQRPLVVETIRAPIPLSRLPQIISRCIQNREKLGWSAIAESLRQSKVKALLGIDSPQLALQKISLYVPEVKQLIVSHGSLRSDNLKKHIDFLGIPKISQNFFVWGEHDVQLVAEHFGEHVQCVAVGSLRNAMYHRHRGQEQTPPQRHELLFVSKFAGSREFGMHAGAHRPRVLAKLKQYLRRYCSQFGVPLHIAMRPRNSGDLEPGQWENEKAHYREVFNGVEVTFTDPAVRYATYAASDCSDVTVGVPSGSLTESFGRGNKVLMFGQSNSTGDHLGFPYEGPWLVKEPTYEVFSSALSHIRHLSKEQFKLDAGDVPKKMLANADSDLAALKIKDAVDAAIAE